MMNSTVFTDEHDPHTSVYREGTDVVVGLSGDHDRSSVAALICVVDSALALTGVDVVFDLTEVEFMDASTISVIVRARDLLQVQSRRLSLRAPSKCARRIVELCGLTELLAIEPRPLSARDVTSAPNASSPPIGLPYVARSPEVTRVGWSRRFEQAKGMIAEYQTCSMEQAFVTLRNHARNHNLRLAELAHHVIDRTLPSVGLDPLPGHATR